MIYVPSTYLYYDCWFGTRNLPTYMWRGFGGHRPDPELLGPRWGKIFKGP